MLLFPSPPLSQLQDFHQFPQVCEQPVLFFFFPFAHHPASCCHSISGKVSLSLANHSGALAVFVRLWRESVRVRSWKNVLSCLAAASLTFFFSYRSFAFKSPPSPRAGFAFKPLPHLRVAVLLLWTFSSVRAKMFASLCSSSVLWLWGRF